MFDRLLERLKGVLRLQSATFEVIERDPKATIEALLVVVAVAIAALIGSFGNDGEEGLLSGVLGAVVGWAIFSGLCYVVGTRFFSNPETSSSWGQLLRVLGYAEAPNVLTIFAFIPLFGGLIAGIGSLWALLAAILGIRQAMEMPYPRAAAVAVIAWVIRLALQLLIALIFGVTSLIFRAF